MRTVEKLRKFAERGKVRKYALGDVLADEEYEDFTLKIKNFSIADQINMSDDENAAFDIFSEAKEDRRGTRKLLGEAIRAGDKEGAQKMRTALRNQTQAIRDNRFQGGLKGQIKENLTTFEKTMSTPEARMGMDMGIKVLNAADDLTMGDKNFGSQSEAIDGAVHGVSSALMQTGNPYAVVAAGVLEGANFLTKAGGQTVQGFDVDINSSGYGDLGHMESSSSRDFGAMIGLGGLNRNKMQAKLAKRNHQALMAMNAANIANEQSFEQEARANSVQNTIMNNQIALAGGLDTSLLGG